MTGVVRLEVAVASRTMPGLDRDLDDGVAREVAVPAGPGRQSQTNTVAKARGHGEGSVYRMRRTAPGWARSHSAGGRTGRGSGGRSPGEPGPRSATSSRSSRRKRTLG